MRTIVTYQSKYGATKAYAEWIGEELHCEVKEAKNLKAADLAGYDTVIHGGGLYAEVIAGIGLISKNFEALKEKNLVVFTTGMTPRDCTEYYEGLVAEKNLKGEMRERVRMFHFDGKMILSELTPVHRTAIRTLKRMFANKRNRTEMEDLLIQLCEKDGDFTDRAEIADLVVYVKGLQSK